MHTLRQVVPGGHPGTLRAGTTEHVYPAADESVPQARRFVAAALRTWGMTAAADDAALVTTELAANAARQGASTSPAEILVRVSRAGRAVVITVGDHDPAIPARTRRMPAAGAEHGRGLPLVTRLAARVSWRQDGDWKIIQATLRAPRPHRAHGHLPWPGRRAA
jgi:anti-sigma regulatory factor (Ser/Thr protein kinase)